MLSHLFKLFLSFLLTVSISQVVGLELSSTTTRYISTDNAQQKTVAPTCGGTVQASYTATALPLPKAETGQHVYCEWWISSRHPTMTIGLAVVDLWFKWFATDSLSIDVYDGFPSNETLLTHWHDRRDMNRFLVPVVSTSSNIFVNYSSSGPLAILEFKFMYYICGGSIYESSYVIQSPLFNASSPQETVGHLSCTWKIKIPSSAKYGYFIVDYLNLPDPPQCNTLLLATFNGTIKAVEREGSKCMNCTNTTYTRDEFYETRTHTCTGIQRFQSNATANLNTTSQSGVLSMNSENIQIVLFNGSTSTLQYTVLSPQQQSGFQLFYEIDRKPYTRRRKVKNTPWYLTYAPLVFYLPIGITLGLAIILLQSPKHPRDLKIKSYPDSGAYSTATSVVDSVAEKPTPKPAIKSIIKRSKSLDPNRMSASSLASTDSPRLLQKKERNSAEKSLLYCREVLSETVDKRRKVTFKRSMAEDG